MKILPRLFWVFVIILLVAELAIFRQAIFYHAGGASPVMITTADKQPLPVNRYVELPAHLQNATSLTIKAPGYVIKVYQPPEHPELFVYDLDGRLSDRLQETPAAATTVAGRLLPLKDAPFARVVRKHFSAGGTRPIYALLVNTNPKKSIFYLYLAAILLTLLLLATCPFMGKHKTKTS